MNFWSCSGSTIGTGTQKLLDLARLLHQQGYDWQAQFADFQYTEPITSEFIKLNKGRFKDLELSSHGVNNAMAIKRRLCGTWFLVSKVIAARFNASLPRSTAITD